jgi:predicted molibdopterin-dependent oxidoreductase YjgC
MAYGPGASKFIEPKRHKQKHYPISDLILLDQERCILCWRCIRYLEEWEDKPQLGLFERGGETRIDTFPERSVDAKTSGNICDICPVGALTNRVSRFRYRPWEIKKTLSVCNHCPVGCNLRLDERVHELRRVVARENAAVNDEWICDKGRFVHQFVDHPERLAKPLVKENGALREATWDEALDRIVEKLGPLADAGANLVGGIAAPRVSNEAAYLFQKFFRVLVGTNNVDFAGGAAVRALPTGLSAIADIGRSDLIVLVGCDPSEAAPLLDLRIKRAVRRNGAKLLIVNPRRTELARYTPAKGAYLLVLPGNVAALLGELAATVQAAKGSRGQESGVRSQGAGGRTQDARGRADVRHPPFAIPSPQHSVEVTQYAIRSTQYTPAIELLNAAKSPLFIYGPDAATGERGRAAVSALMGLANALGQGDRLAYIGAGANEQGARDMGLLPDALPGYAALNDAAVRERLGKLWGIAPPAEGGQAYAQMLGGGVKGLWVMGDNPAAQPAVAEALRKLDFLVVQDLFLTETAQLADVVLPACSFAEADGTYTNLERRVQRGPQGIRAVGESRPDWAILAALAEKWSTAQTVQTFEVSETSKVSEVPDWKRKKRKVKTGPAPKPWHYPTAQSVLEEIGKAVPFYAALRWEALGEGGVQWSAKDLRFRISDFGTANPQSAIINPQSGDLLLVSSPLLWDADLFMQHAAEQVRKLTPAPFVALNPADVAAAKLVEGSPVRVTSDSASVPLPLKSDASVQPGTAWIPANLAGLPAELLGADRGEVVAVAVKGVN